MDSLIILSGILIVIVLTSIYNLGQNRNENVVGNARVKSPQKDPSNGKKLNYPELSLNQLRELPRQSGIYFFMVGETVVYVGESNNVYRRLNEDEHHVLTKLRKNPNLKIRYKLASPHKGTRLREEISWIRHYRPAMNLKDLVKTNYNH